MTDITSHPNFQIANFQALCDELSLLATDGSLWANPLEWTHLNTRQVLGTAARHFGPYACTFEGIMIYQRVTVFAFGSLLKQSRIEDVRELINRMESWKAWDTIQCLSKHQTVKGYLWEVIESCLDPGPLHTGYSLDRLFLIDNMAIDAHLLSVLEDRDMSANLLAQRGQEAQSLLNILQERSDFPIDPSIKRLHTSILFKLSRASGLYPECMVFQDIKLTGRCAETAGGYGDVWKGLFRGQTIAVKVLKVYQKSDMVKLLKEFSCEAVIWRQLRHPNVLPFYGVYHPDDDRSRLCLSSPWMDNGTIIRFLDDNPDTNCICLIMDIAQGLHYLHDYKPQIIHGDLKGANILITPSGRACLADFGLATARDSKAIVAISTSTRRSGGRLRWQAPELLSSEDDSHEHNSLASDVYAFACVCYEIFSGKLPFHEISNEDWDWVILLVVNGKRPTCPSDNRSIARGLEDTIWKLIESCWAQQPTERPTAGQIVEQVQALPNEVVDRRPIDKFHSPFPSATIHNVQSFFPRHHTPIPTPPHQYPYSEYAGMQSSESATAQFDWPPATHFLDLLPDLSPPATPTYSHVEQYQEWRDMPLLCPIAGPLRLFVPQRVYKPHTSSDHRRYVEEVILDPPIIFEVKDPSEWGIALDDALKFNSKRLVDKEALMFEGRGPSLSIRLEWPGAQWSRQIPTKDFRSPPMYITKAKLARNIAKCIQRFIKDTQDKPIGEDVNALRFRVGAGRNDIKLEDLVLVSLHHVAQGSWQPHLRLRRQL